MAVKLLLLILALAWSDVTTRGQDNYRPRPRDLTWGAEANGLRMAVWTTPATDKLFIAVRNFSRKKICYCGLLHVSELKVYARKDSVSPWLELWLKTAPQGIAVALCYLNTLKPNEETPSYELRNGERKRLNYSLSLNLREYSFPAEWSGTAEVKIVRPTAYCIGDKYKIGQVESPVVKIKLPFAEAGASR